MKKSIKILSIVLACVLAVGAAGFAAWRIWFYEKPVDGNTTVLLGGEKIKYDQVLAAPGSSAPDGMQLTYIKGYADLLQQLNARGAVRVRTNDDYYYITEKNMSDLFSGGMAVPESAPAPVPAIGAVDSVQGVNFSQTNSQVQGVEEGDIIKNDGRYLYIARENRVYIVSAEGADMEVTATITFSGEGDIHEFVSEMYVQNDRLAVVVSRTVSKTGTDGFAAWCRSRQYVCYNVYDISDRSKPELVREFCVEGVTVSSRMIGDRIYFVNNQWISVEFSEDLTENDLLPSYKDTLASAEYVTVPPQDIAICPVGKNADYLLVGSFSLNDDVPCVPDVMLGAGSQIYMSLENMYVTLPNYQGAAKTEIMRFEVTEDGLALQAVGSVPGYIVNQYSMDEYGGHFRIAATTSDSENIVYVLNMDLKKVGQSKSLATGETIQSVRFMGDTAYVVTFLNTDPLFVLDMANPKQPAVLGELKIPGFSQYLHPVGDGWVIGFGRHTQEYYVKNEDGSETVVGTIDRGLKASLFDVRDPFNPKEADVLLLGEGYSEAFYNPNAIMTDPAKNRFAFAMECYDGSMFGNDAKSGCVVLRVENGEIIKEAAMPFEGGKWAYNGRIAFIDDTFYLVSTDSIAAYSADFEKLAEIKLER